MSGPSSHSSPALLVLLTWLRENSKHVLLMRQTVGQTVRHKDRRTVDKETFREDKETRTWIQIIRMKNNTHREGLTKIQVGTDSINIH